MSIAYKKNGVWVTASGTPPIDNALSATSENAVQNKIVKAAIENSASTLQQNFQAGVDDVYDAVVAKGSTPVSKSLSDVIQGIADIPAGSGNAASGDVLSGKTFTNSNGAQTGSMTNRGAVSQTLDASTTSYTIPEGYHNGNGKVSITTQTKSVTPSSSAKTITPDSGKVLSSVNVGAVNTDTEHITIYNKSEYGFNSSSTSITFTLKFPKDTNTYLLVTNGAIAQTDFDYQTAFTTAGARFFVVTNTSQYSGTPVLKLTGSNMDQGVGWSKIGLFKLPGGYI